MLLLSALLPCAVLPAFAQISMIVNSSATKTFTRVVQLGKGNYLRADLAAAADLKHLNIDSLTAVFLKDLALVDDTIAVQVADKRFEYRVNSTGVNLLTITESAEAAATYAFTNGKAAIVKTGQDTIGISGRADDAADHWYRLQFFLNNYTDLSRYNNIHLQDSLQKAPAEIVIAAPAEKVRLLFSFKPAACIQHYKNALVPSFSLHAEFQKEQFGMHYDYGLFSDDMFAFEKTAAGSRRTYINTFAGISFSRYKISDARNGRGSMPLYISLAYLVNHGGELFDPHSFRLGVGRLNLFSGNATIEPLLYFHDFFREVSPGIKFSVIF